LVALIGGETMSPDSKPKLPDNPKTLCLVFKYFGIERLLNRELERVGAEKSSG
jgi:hypothetical protein